VRHSVEIAGMVDISSPIGVRIDDTASITPQQGWKSPSKTLITQPAHRHLNELNALTPGRPSASGD